MRYIRITGTILVMLARIRISTRWAALVLLGALVVSACGGGNASSSDDGELSGKLTVFAAASLQESFTELKKEFEREHPDVDVKLSFAGSSQLVRQLERGAPADVFASADEAQMTKAVDADTMAGKPTTFVRNKLQIAVPKGNPADVDGLGAFGAEKPRIAVCAKQVPCGAAARKALDAADIDLRADTLEQDVKAVLTKVRLGEADAGLVYRTDVISAGDKVEGVDFDGADKALNDYGIGTTADAPNSAAGRAFVKFVGSAKAQGKLADYGFETDRS